MEPPRQPEETPEQWAELAARAKAKRDRREAERVADISALRAKAEHYFQRRGSPIAARRLSRYARRLRRAGRHGWSSVCTSRHFGLWYFARVPRTYGDADAWLQSRMRELAEAQGLRLTVHQDARKGHMHWDLELPETPTLSDTDRQPTT